MTYIPDSERTPGNPWQKVVTTANELIDQADGRLRQTVQLVDRSEEVLVAWSKQADILSKKMDGTIHRADVTIERSQELISRADYIIDRAHTSITRCLALFAAACFFSIGRKLPPNNFKLMQPAIKPYSTAVVSLLGGALLVYAPDLRGSGNASRLKE